MENQESDNRKLIFGLLTITFKLARTLPLNIVEINVNAMRRFTPTALIFLRLQANLQLKYEVHPNTTLLHISLNDWNLTFLWISSKNLKILQNILFKNMFSYSC